MSNEIHKTYIDPPSGWKYGFPKEAPANLREMTEAQLNEWLVANGYPKSEVEAWTKSGKYKSVPCRFFTQAVEQEDAEELLRKANEEIARLKAKVEDYERRIGDASVTLYDWDGWYDPKSQEGNAKGLARLIEDAYAMLQGRSWREPKPEVTNAMADLMGWDAMGGNQ